MTRIKQQIPQGRWLLRADTVDSYGECTLCIRYYLGKYVKRNTGIKVPEKAWDEVRQCVKPALKDASRINSELRRFKNEIDDRLEKFQGRITLEVLRNILDGGDGKIQNCGERFSRMTDFCDFAHAVNDMCYSNKKYGYSAWYNKKLYIDAFGTFVKKYLKIRRYALLDLDLDTFNQYIQYRFDFKNNKSKEAVNKSLVPLYAAIKYSIDIGLMKIEEVSAIMGNYLEVRETEYRPDDDEVEGKVRYLSKEEIDKLKVYQTKVKNTRTREILDFFFFSYYACGMRLSDVMTLEWKHIDFEQRVIRKIQFKTKRMPDVLPPLNDSAMEILERWKNYGRNSRFVFDLLPEDFDMKNQDILYKERISKAKTFNTSLHVAAMTLRFKQGLTFHMARHSFAVAAINRGMSVHMLSKLLGHSTILSTEKTYAVILKERVDRETQMLIDL